jgi:hypothetical protein
MAEKSREVGWSTANLRRMGGAGLGMAMLRGRSANESGSLRMLNHPCAGGASKLARRIWF